VVVVVVVEKQVVGVVHPCFQEVDSAEEGETERQEITETNTDTEKPEHKPANKSDCYNAIQEAIRQK